MYNVYILYASFIIRTVHVQYVYNVACVCLCFTSIEHVRVWLWKLTSGRNSLWFVQRSHHRHKAHEICKNRNKKAISSTAVINCASKTYKTNPPSIPTSDRNNKKMPIWTPKDARQLRRYPWIIKHDKGKLVTPYL